MNTGLFWTARLLALAVAGLLLLMLITESGSGPDGIREWLYLLFFPVGFSISYLLGWRWPLPGGLASLTCMVLSQLVIHRIYDFQAYLIWAVLCIPGVLYLFAGAGARTLAGKRIKRY